MITKYFFGFLSVACGLLVGCNSAGSNAGDGTITVVEQDGGPLTICDGRSVKDTITMPLSDLVEDCRLVRLENLDTALFKFSGTVISDNYIGIRNSGGAFKLFDKDGKFLCDVGAVGQGPGEYQNLYDEMIDESNKCIYLAPFYGSSKIWKYNLDGMLVEAFDFGEELNKAKIGLNPDGTISIVHMLFKGMNSFTAAHVAKDGMITKYVTSESMQVAPGYEHDIFSYQNVPEFAVSITTTDTMYHYNFQKNKHEPRFVMSWNAEEKPFRLYNELPGYFVTSMWGKGVVFVDKKANTSNYVKLKNDFLGNMDTPANFAKGYFFSVYEPYALIEKIDTRLKQSDCSDADRKMLEELKASIDENDNSYMLVGKLKK